MRTIKPYYRPVNAAIVQAFWDMGLDTYEIALRTGFKESEVHKVISDYVERKQVERISDQDHRSSTAEHE